MKVCLDIIKAMFDRDRDFRDRLYSLDRNGSSFYDWLDPPDVSDIAIRLLGVPAEVPFADWFDEQDGDWDAYESEYGPVFIWDGLYAAWFDGDFDAFVALCGDYTNQYNSQVAAWKKAKEVLFV